MKNVLVIGLGSIARKHIQALNSIDEEFNIYALRSNPNSAFEPGIQNIYHLADLPVIMDFAIISNPTYLHAQFIELLCTKNIPLFIEKPPLNSMEGAAALAAVIEEQRVITYVACNLRFHPCLIFIKAYLVENPHLRINEVNSYCGSYLPNWRPNVDFRSVYSANKEMGGGVHLDLFHEIDYVHWIFGQPKSVRCLKRSVSSLEINAVDYANYQLSYDDFVASIVLNYYRKDSKRKIEILFDDVTWEIDLINHTISAANELIFQATDFALSQTYLDQLQYFMDCVSKNQTPMNTFSESLEILKTCLCDE